MENKDQSETFTLNRKQPTKQKKRLMGYEKWTLVEDVHICKDIIDAFSLQMEFSASAWFRHKKWYLLLISYTAIKVDF